MCSNQAMSKLVTQLAPPGHFGPRQAEVVAGASPGGGMSGVLAALTNRIAQRKSGRPGTAPGADPTVLTRPGP